MKVILLQHIAYYQWEYAVDEGNPATSFSLLSMRVKMLHHIDFIDKSSPATPYKTATDKSDSDAEKWTQNTLHNPTARAYVT